jgi:hypothetical protein
MVLAAAFAALTAGIGVMQFGPGPVTAQTPVSGLSLWISVDGVADCGTQTGDASCELAPGSTFLVAAHIDPLPASIPSYGGFDLTLEYVGVSANQDASTDSWPDCAFPASYFGASGQVQFGCAVGVPPAPGSTYSGVIGTVSFVCGQSGSIELLHGAGLTDVVEFDNISEIDGEVAGNSDKLTINCVPGGVEPPPVTPGGPAVGTSTPVVTLEPTAAAVATSTARQQATATAIAVATAGGRTPGTTNGGDDDDGGGLSGGVIAIIIIAGVAAAGIAGVVGWRVMQSRGGGGAPPA